MIKLSVRSSNNAPLFDYFQPKVVMPVIPDGGLIPYIKYKKYESTKLISSFGNCAKQKKSIYKEDKLLKLKTHLNRVLKYKPIYLYMQRIVEEFPL